MRTTPASYGSRSGFTLVELMLVIFLVGVISASLATIFRSSTDLARATSERNDLQEGARNALNRIVRELENSTKIYYSGPDNLHFDTSYNLGSTVVSEHVVYEPMNGGIYLSKDWGASWQPYLENVTSFRVRGMTLWSTLDDEWSILSPELGNGGSITGSTTFKTMKHSSGYYAGTGWPVNTISFSMPDLLCDDQGTIEFWYRPEYSIDYSNGSYAKYLISTRNGFGRDIKLYYDPGTQQLIYKVEAGANPEIRWTPDWEIGSLVHIAVTWSSSGRNIGGGRTMALFINGVEESDTGTQTSVWTAGGAFGDSIVLGDSNAQYPSQATFDNLKVYDYCKSRFDDRNTCEISGIIDIEITLNGGNETVTLRSAANVR